MNRASHADLTSGAFAKLSALAAAVGGIGAVCYAIGYLIALGSSLKLGLPVNVQENQALIVRGASFPLGVITNGIVALRHALSALSWWHILSRGFVLLWIAAIVVMIFRAARPIALVASIVGLAASLSANWAPLDGHGLLLDSPDYLTAYDRRASDATRIARQLQKDIAVSEAERDPQFKSALSERVMLRRADLFAAQRDLAVQRDAIFKNHELVYCTFFRSEARCDYVAVTRFAWLAASTAVVVSATWWWAQQGLRPWLLAILAMICTLDVSFLVIDFGWLMGRTTFNVAQTAPDDRVIYLGEAGDRYLLFSPETRALTMRAKSDVTRLTLTGTADVFVEIERAAGGIP